MTRGWLLIMTVALGACGDGGGGAGPLDVEGKPGEEAARLVATRYCEREVRCGRAGVECTGSGSAGGGASTLRCTGKIEPVDHADCFDDVFGDLREVLACKPITGPEATIIRACFEPMIARACLVQADVDREARLREMGQETSLNPMPAACQQLITDLSGRCP